MKTAAVWGVALLGVGIAWAQVGCPVNALCGQDAGPCGSDQWFFYSDLEFCTAPPTTCARVRCEDFPPPGVPDLTRPIIGVIWRGLDADDNAGPCTKYPSFRIRFYEDAGGAPEDPLAPYYEEYVTATVRPLQWTITLCLICPEIQVYEFTAILSNPVSLGRGWFSICGTGTPGCYHLWAGSNEGDNLIYGWFEEDGTIPGPPVTNVCDLSYCLMPLDSGACCLDRTGECLEGVPQYQCGELGGRWLDQGLCSQMQPPCGDGLGACCYDDGSCDLQTAANCDQPPVCIGDMNCDGQVDFADINPFVLFLTAFDVWTFQFVWCNPLNGDINQDGTYGQGSFGDINPFVDLLTNGPLPILCPGFPYPETYWAGYGTNCYPWPTGGCCTVVVPPGANLENEPNDCATPDTFNGGCAASPPALSSIACGQTIYGESGTRDGYRDADWYQVVAAGNRSFTATVEAEFDVTVAAYRAGPSPSDPCGGYRDVAKAVSGGKCSTVQLVTRCLPAGTYWFVVTPTEPDGVRCGADYRLTLECSGYCEVLNSCGDGPGGAYVEGTANPAPPEPGYCDLDPNDPLLDPENGGCQETPPAFEPLPHDPLLEPDTFTFCGKVWANGGYRDLDFYALDLDWKSQVHWQVLSEVPVRVTLLFQDLGGGVYGPPSCDSYTYWADTLYHPCVADAWLGTMFYQPGSYWFLIAPEDGTGPLFYGYPCPMDGADLGNDYTITMTVDPIHCENEILAKAVSNIESEPVDCNDPLAYVDTYNSGCDAATPPGPVLTLNFDAANAWRGRSFAVADPNVPGALRKDYDWYQFQVTGGNKRFKVYLYADFPVTWEVWPSSDCADGPIEGLDVPACYEAGVYTRRCYVIGTYWLRVYPTRRATCGRSYYLALADAGACSVCNFAPAGNYLDDACGGVDTNAGCEDPNAPAGFMTFNCGATYWGVSYAAEVDGVGTYDPDWFQLTQTNTNNRRIKLTVTAEFLAQVEVYLSCYEYANDNPISGLDGITPLVVNTACPNIMLTATTGLPPGTTVYGRITIVDQFGNLLTDYYPCANGWNRWKVVTACII
jgi:hypothetical protein